MTYLIRSENNLNPITHVIDPIEENGFTPSPLHVSLFDQNGYDLTWLEIQYYEANMLFTSQHRNYTHIALKTPWFETSEDSVEGAHLNHCLLFERKGFAGAARAQVEKYAKEVPLYSKVLAMRPKWGFDFSMDYADRDGNCFEVFHYEYDGFSYEQIIEHQDRLEQVIINTDWNDAAKALLNKKDEWHNLDFFAQSDYKCNYFGLPPERFKEVIWE